MDGRLKRFKRTKKETRKRTCSVTASATPARASRPLLYEHRALAFVTVQVAGHTPPSPTLPLAQEHADEEAERKKMGAPK